MDGNKTYQSREQASIIATVSIYGSNLYNFFDHKNHTLLKLLSLVLWNEEASIGVKIPWTDRVLNPFKSVKNSRRD